MTVDQGGVVTGVTADRRTGAPPRGTSNWAIGWSAFASVLMVMTGLWWAFSGLVAIVDEGFFLVTEEYIFQFDATTWGWVHLILGIVIFIAGLSVYRGGMWARAVGTALALISGLAAFAWLPYYPIWAILFIAMSVAVMWALTVYPGMDSVA